MTLLDSHMDKDRCVGREIALDRDTRLRFIVSGRLGKEGTVLLQVKDPNDEEFRSPGSTRFTKPGNAEFLGHAGQTYRIVFHNCYSANAMLFGENIS